MRKRQTNRTTTRIVSASTPTAVYLDCNATTPLEPRVAAEVRRLLEDEVGNAGSNTHEYGTRAKHATQKARAQVASVVDAQADEVTFTSGATESNNLALLGLADYGRDQGLRHVIATQIEHKAVLEPLLELGRLGFEVELVPPNREGWIEPETIARALRKDTLIVSVMHANNETGVVQPLKAIADVLGDHPAFLHVDAAQGYGKDFAPLRTRRIDLISVSGHKIYGPMGVGALVARRRRYARPPLRPLTFGGGQEAGLRPGTLPVPLVVGFGFAAEVALQESNTRADAVLRYRRAVLNTFAPLDPVFIGDQSRVLPHVVNLAIPGLDSEAVMIALKGIIAVSNGSACTSQNYEPSHVLKAMQLSDSIVRGAVRISWCHLTPIADWASVSHRLRSLMS